MSATTDAVQVTRVPLSQLHPAPWNPRLIKDARFQQLTRSLEADPEFLWQRPILATIDGTVFAGNMRLRAAQHLGWTDIPAILCDIPEQLAKERALRDNNQFGEWREDDLATLLHQLEQQGADLPNLGFDEKDLQKLLARFETEGPALPDPGPEIERAQELRAKWQTDAGQLWLIDSLSVPGKSHRLLCGDSTKEEDVVRVMDGERAALFATDPPYAVNYDGTNHPTKTSRRARTPKEDPTNKDWSKSYKDWDQLDSGQGEALYDAFIAVAMAHAIQPDAAWYCWHASRNQAMVERVWEKHGAFVHQQIMWAKDRGVLTRSWYLWAHEPCLMGWVRGRKPKRTSSDYPTTVWTLPTTLPGTETDHPTVKPTEVFAIPMRQHTVVGDVCYEPFSGSGTQTAAGEQLGRLVYAMELAPEFVAVALERLAGMGLTPRLAEPG